MKKLFFALPILLASCQSERVAFHFQSGALAASPAPRSEVMRPVAALPPATAVPAAAREALPAPTAATRKPSQRLLASHQPPQVAPVALTEQPALATNSAEALPAQRPRLLRRLGRQHATAGPARTTESGLGNIGLFAIAVVLGVLAGLGALVSLIPGVSFLGGVGLAAAGLVVLFILYSLVSGGGKKKKAPAK